MKKVISIMLCVFMLASLMVMNASAAVAPVTTAIEEVIFDQDFEGTNTTDELVVYGSVGEFGVFEETEDNNAYKLVREEGFTTYKFTGTSTLATDVTDSFSIQFDYYPTKMDLDTAFDSYKDSYFQVCVNVPGFNGGNFAQMRIVFPVKSLALNTWHTIKIDVDTTSGVCDNNSVVVYTKAQGAADWTKMSPNMQNNEWSTTPNQYRLYNLITASGSRVYDDMNRLVGFGMNGGNVYPAYYIDNVKVINKNLKTIAAATEAFYTNDCEDTNIAIGAIASLVAGATAADGNAVQTAEWGGRINNLDLPDKYIFEFDWKRPSGAKDDTFAPEIYLYDFDTNVSVQKLQVRLYGKSYELDKWYTARIIVDAKAEKSIAYGTTVAVTDTVQVYIKEKGASNWIKATQDVGLVDYGTPEAPVYRLLSDTNNSNQMGSTITIDILGIGQYLAVDNYRIYDTEKLAVTNYTEEAGQLAVDVEYQAVGFTGATLTPILALYDADGALVNVGYNAVAPGTVTTVSAEMGEATNAALYIWDSITGGKPILADVIDIDAIFGE